jgi:hypothetical protein
VIRPSSRIVNPPVGIVEENGQQRGRRAMPEEVAVEWGNRHADCRPVRLRFSLILSRYMRHVTSNEIIIVPPGSVQITL